MKRAIFLENLTQKCLRIFLIDSDFYSVTHFLVLDCRGQKVLEGVPTGKAEPSRDKVKQVLTKEVDDLANSLQAKA